MNVFIYRHLLMIEVSIFNTGLSIYCAIKLMKALRRFYNIFSRENRIIKA